MQATTGDTPDYIADEDLRTPDQLRGDMKAIRSAKLTLGERATVEGVRAEITKVKQQLEMTHDQMRTLVSIYQTLQNEFTQYKEQRIKELNVKINHGSTTAED